MEEIKHLLGKRIKEIRKEKNISQERLASLINIEKRNLSNIENGHVFPSRTLGEIAVALNVEIQELFDFEHLKEDLNYKKQFINKSIEEFPEDKINIIYRVTRALK